MAKIQESTLGNWTKPPSNNEEAKLKNAEKLVKDAIKADPKLSKMEIDIFGQGSYENNTNVKLNSDIDINVMYTSGFYFDLPPGKTREDYGLTNPSKYSFSEFKDDVEIALRNKFKQDVTRQNKCIEILENTTRIQTDVVPTWKHIQYYETGDPVIGCQLSPDNGNWITNYPKQHIENGIAKNKRTSRRYKSLIRIHKKLRYSMIDQGIEIDDSIKSFLLECLVWNCPDSIFNNATSWTEMLKSSIIHLHKQTKEDETCKDWGEVSERLYLIRPSRKWTREGINKYLTQIWNYLDF